MGKTAYFRGGIAHSLGHFPGTIQKIRVHPVERIMLIDLLAVNFLTGSTG
jgi:hypothetical protein